MDNLLNDNIVNKVQRDNCFDFLRYLFALSLIIAHFCTLTGQEQFWFITGSMRVKAFFTITGFLVSYSFLRRNCDIRSYTVKRVARIVPAYIVCIFFCLILGWVVSSLSTLEFFSSWQTLKYTLCNLLMLNWLEPELPSTFQNNIRPQMNGSLWSMKQEVIFYMIVPMLVWLMKKKTGKRTLLLPVIAVIVLTHNFVPVQIQYFMYFFTGLIILMFFEFFTKYIKYILPAAILLEIPVYWEIPFLTDVCCALEPLTFSSILVGAAYCLKPLNVFRKYDNVTYGLYLYHFPVIQLLILYGVKDYNIFLCFFLTIVITTAFACVSWFLLEKPLINKCKKV